MRRYIVFSEEGRFVCYASSEIDAEFLAYMYNGYYEVEYK